MANDPIIDYRKLDQTGYSSVWLKYVRGVDLTQHCIASLIGERHQALDRTARSQVIRLDEHPTAPAYYLCGVTYPYDWFRNVHLLAVPAPGEIHEHLWAGVAMTLYDLKPVEITQHYIDPTDPHAKDRLFRSCRNWQAAWYLHRILGLVNELNPESLKWRGSGRRKRRQLTFGDLE